MEQCRRKRVSSDQGKTKFPPTTRKYSGKWPPEKSEKAFRRAEKIWKRYLVLDYCPELGKIKMRDSFEKQYRMILVLTVADDRRVRNLGIYVVVDYVSLNDFY